MLHPARSCRDAAARYQMQADTSLKELDEMLTIGFTQEDLIVSADSYSTRDRLDPV
jgi:hypothetical protein